MGVETRLEEEGKALRPIVAFGIAVVIVAATASSGGAGENAKLSCKFQNRDLVCRIKQVLVVKPGPRRPPKIKRLKPGSTLKLRRQGEATLFLGREAKCNLRANGGLTTIKTRPSDDALFEQGIGESRCTIAGEKQTFITGQSPGARTTSAVEFGAVVRTQAGDEPVQVRIRYRPKSSVAIALNLGRAEVVLTTGRHVGLGEKLEMRAALTKRNTIKPGSLHVGDAHFNAAEERLWQQEARTWSRLSVETEGSGTVVSSPVGIDCPEGCDASYPNGTVVTLTARPLEGWEFLGWSDGCTGTKSRCTVTMNRDMFVTAIFAQPGRLTHLTVSKQGSGTITSSPAGIDCGSICEWDYDSGMTVKLAASAAGGSTFSGWSGSCSGMDNPCRVTMDAAKSVTAKFAPALVGTFRLSVDKQGDGSGTVTSFPAGIDCGSSCEAQFVPGTVQLAAHAAPGSSFAGWSSGPCAQNVNPCIFTLNSATAVTATFVQPFHLSVEKQGSGTGTVTSDGPGIWCGDICGATFESGTTVALWASPSEGSRFGGWSSGPCGVSDNPCLVSMNASQSVTAEFVQQFTLTVEIHNAEGGAVTSNPSGIDNCRDLCAASYDVGTSVTLTATNDEGWVFYDGWGGACAPPDPCSVNMAADRYVTATFHTP